LASASIIKGVKKLNRWILVTTLTLKHLVRSS
jgi:hypothetical protein